MLNVAEMIQIGKDKFKKFHPELGREDVLWDTGSLSEASSSDEEEDLWISESDPASSDYSCESEYGSCDGDVGDGVARRIVHGGRTQKNAKIVAISARGRRKKVSETLDHAYRIGVGCLKGSCWENSSSPG
jgi:hypothetical protein